MRAAIAQLTFDLTYDIDDFITILKKSKIVLLRVLTI